MRALEWLDKVCLPQGARHFYAYKTRSRDGLDNQSWKDSSDAIVDEDGKPVKQPVATCEEQAAVFTAKVAMDARARDWCAKLEVRGFLPAKSQRASPASGTSCVADDQGAG